MKDAFTGFLTGIVNGLFGSGGGMIAVPCMKKFQNIPQKKANATAIAIILPLTLISICIYIFKVQIPYKEVLLVSLGGFLGGIVGAKLLNKLKGRIIGIIFGIFILIGAFRMVFL